MPTSPADAATDAAATAHARAEIAHAAREHQILLSGLRVKLTTPGPSSAGATMAQATAHADGRRIRVEASGDNPLSAVGSLVDRCAARLAVAHDGWSPRPWPDANRADQPGPPLVHRSYGRITRTKTVTPAVCHVQVAAATMDALDYDAHLFIDATTLEHALIHRGGPVGYRIAFVRRSGPPQAGDLPLVADPAAAPELVPAAAVARLDTTLLPFLLFADPESGDGRLLYRRYDGDYGLLIPIESTMP
jgi:hypothetical protein